MLSVNTGVGGVRAREGSGVDAGVAALFCVATLLQCGDCLLTVLSLEVPLGLLSSVCSVGVLHEHGVNVSVTMRS